MIAKKIRVKNVEKGVAYLLVDRKVEVICASPDILEILPPDLSSPDCARILAAALQANLVLRPEVRVPFRHYSFSAAPEDQIENRWADFGAKVGQSHGCVDGVHSYIFLRHLDRPHDHGHWFECRVGTDGSLLRDLFRDLAREQALCRRAEIEYGLRPLMSSIPELPTQADRKKPKRPRAPNRAEREIAQRQPTKKELARSELDQVWPAPGELVSYAEFCERLQARGIDIILNRKGASVGVSYSVDGEKWKASTLGDAYQWAAIEAHLLPEVDNRSAELATRKAVTPPVLPPPLPPSQPATTKPEALKSKRRDATPLNLLQLLERAHEQPATVYQREERRRNREDFARVAAGGQHAYPANGGGRGSSPSRHRRHR